jgi:hypothetical protein
MAEIAPIAILRTTKRAQIMKFLEAKDHDYQQIKDLISNIFLLLMGMSKNCSLILNLTMKINSLVLR